VEERFFGNEKGERGSEIGAVARGNRKGKMKEKGKGVHGQPGREGERERERKERKERRERKEREREKNVDFSLSRFSVNEII
jgi:hypothetical protein